MADEQPRFKPTDEVVKDAATFLRRRLGEPLGVEPDAYDAWLAERDRETARKALDRFIAYAEDAAEHALTDRSADDWRATAWRAKDYLDQITTTTAKEHDHD